MTTEIDEAKADAEGCGIERDELARDVDLRRRLNQSGIAASRTLETAESAHGAASARCIAAAARLDRLTVEKRAAENGVYLRDGGNDTPYSQQQRDRLMLRRQEVEAQLPLIDVADCPDASFRSSCQSGRPRASGAAPLPRSGLLGSDEWITGIVERMRGSSAPTDERLYAAQPSAPIERQVSIDGLLAAGVSGQDSSRQCDIGRQAEVRFERSAPRPFALVGSAFAADLRTGAAQVNADFLPLHQMLAPLIIVAGVRLLPKVVMPMERQWARYAMAAFVAAVVARYLVWRVGTTLDVDGMGPLASGWVMFCFAIEMFALFDAAILYLIFLRTTAGGRGRSPRTADARPAARRGAQR